MSDDKPDHHDESPKSRDHGAQVYAEVKKFSTKHGTIRTGIITVGVVVCVWIITDAVVNLLDKPPWLVAFLAIVSSIIAPLVHNYILRSRIKRYTEESSAKYAELQKKIDPDRSTSGLERDGSTPKDDE